jgi:hypothetical protein
MNHKKIQASARGQDCTVRIPMVCNHNPETVVLAHINGVRFGHGVGKKTSLGAYCCSACHDVLDGRVKTDIDRQYLKLAHYEGVMETLTMLEEKGLL